MNGARTHERQPAVRFLRALLNDRLLLVLLVFAVLIGWREPEPLSAYPGWIDWPTILTLAGLMLLTKGIELSGYLDHLGRVIIRNLETERLLALFLVGAAALLAMFLTNDIALFIVVPLTLSMRSDARLPLGRLVIFEALAVNAGSLLTPIGNPQNILLWQKSGLSFAAFTLQMLPLAALLLAALLALTAVAFPAEPVAGSDGDQDTHWNTRMLEICALFYVAFVAAVEFGHPGWALPPVFAVMLLLYRDVLRKLDWGLLAVFMLMFIDIHLASRLGSIGDWLGRIGRLPQWQLYLGGVLDSQVISNVPATILITKYAAASKTVAYAVNAGGFGFVLGSLANLIALRMLGERRAWLRFHFYSVPFLVFGGALGYLLLRYQ